MRHLECKCLICGQKTQICFTTPPFPEVGESFLHFCKSCGHDTTHVRTLTRKACAEEKRRQAEASLRHSIMEHCATLGLSCRFLYQSVVVSSPIADWSFDYHKTKITLYHESTIKINFATGDYSKVHKQFENKKMSPLQVLDYIAAHDKWRAQQKSEQ